MGGAGALQNHGEGPPLVGVSPAMQEVRAFIARVGPTNETVAISGETGSGKEVVARHLHTSSARADKPFLTLNAACIPRELFESELFGHRRGAFTGATSDHLGVFREAEGGTLFIDEVAELPIDSQAKLLRALEARCIRPVGSPKELPVDVRILAATNRDLWAEVRAGRFREDLYFRLHVFPIVIAPLRARKEDVIPLAEHLLTRIGPGVTLSDDAQAALVAYDWPGNVRELLNVLRRASLFATETSIDGELMRRMLAASIFAYPQGEGIVRAVGSGAAARRERSGSDDDRVRHSRRGLPHEPRGPGARAHHERACPDERQRDPDRPGPRHRPANAPAKAARLRTRRRRNRVTHTAAAARRPPCFAPRS
jgi:DNA-binding NtrC family response regulator